MCVCCDVYNIRDDLFDHPLHVYHSTNSSWISQKSLKSDAIHWSQLPKLTTLLRLEDSGKNAIDTT